MAVAPKHPAAGEAGAVGADRAGEADGGLVRAVPSDYAGTLAVRRDGGRGRGSEPAMSSR